MILIKNLFDPLKKLKFESPSYDYYLDFRFQ